MTGKEQLLAASAGLHYVEVDGTGIEQARTFKDKDTGLTKPLPGRQNAFLWQGGRYPIQISIDIPEGKPPYRPGLYLMTGQIFEAGKFGRVEFRGMRNCELIDLAIAVEALAGLHTAETGEIIDFKPKTKAA